MRTLGGSSQSRIDRFCLSFSNLNSSSSVTSSNGITSNSWTNRSISHSSNSNSKRNKVACLFVISMLIRRVRRESSSSDNTITSGTRLTGSTNNQNPTTNISSSAFNSCVDLTCIVCVSHLQVLLYISPTAQTADGVATKWSPRASRC